jgi:VIT1/CCC1 family predicted Fe2+/Mn2+ transporter
LSIRTSPWQAAWASLVSFAVGALIPLVAIVLPPLTWRVWTCAVAVVAGLVLTGVISARLGASPVWRAVRRNVVVGSLTMVVTYYVGLLFGVTVG